MKGKICSGLLLALSIMAMLSLNVCFDSVSALSYTYDGIILLVPKIPLKTTLDSDLNRQSIDWDYNYSGSFGEFWTPTDDQVFRITFSGVSSEYIPTSFATNLSALSLDYSNNMCNLYGSDVIEPLLRSGSNVFQSWKTTYDKRITPFYFSNGLTSNFCQYNGIPFGQSPLPEFNKLGLPSTGTIICGLDNGASCNGLWDKRNYIRSQILPYRYTMDGFYIRSQYIDTSSGIHYDYSSNLNAMFEGGLHSFHSLSIPLYSYDEYWTDASNFYEDRHLSFKGVFNFDSSVTWNPDFNNADNSYFRVALFSREYGTSSNDTNVTLNTQYFPCNVTTRQVGDVNFQIEYTCEGDLNQNSYFLYPVLQINGGSLNGSSTYVFITDSDWRLANQLLITDNDSTPASEHFNANLTGNHILGSAEDHYTEGEADWFSSLANLFNFNFINPFAPIFQLFSDQSECASIPTLAGMLHSEETQVCPWFDSNTRAIVTPVLGITSVMLVFGFAVRWLGSSSGNLFEDSHESENYSFSNKFRRGKK